MPRSRFAWTMLLLPFLSGFAPAQSLASGQIDLQVGTRFPHRLRPGPLHPVQPALSLEGSLIPRGWPIGVAGYASAAADWYEGQTLSYPGFNDWLSVNNRVVAVELGGGLQKSWPVGRARLAVGGGVMNTRVHGRMSRDSWAVTTSRSAWGKWAGAGVTSHVGRHTGVGLNARYSWTNADEFGAGGLLLGLALGWTSLAN